MDGRQLPKVSRLFLLGNLMAYDVKKLKQTADRIAEHFNINPAEAVRVVGYINTNAPEQLPDIIAGNFSNIKTTLDNMGIKSGATVKTENQDARETTPDIIAGEIVNPAELPEDIPERIQETIETFCTRFNIDTMDKARQTQWSACCRFIGQNIFKKNRDILADRERARRNGGGFCYDLKKVNALCDIWIALCKAYIKAPMIDDFGQFAAVDESFIYGNSGKYTAADRATPERVRLLQKLHDAQERGLADMIIDGKQNPTGALAVLNHWHGWTQTREIIHTTAQQTTGAASLPVFDSSTGLLETRTGS